MKVGFKNRDSTRVWLHRTGDVIPPRGKPSPGRSVPGFEDVNRDFQAFKGEGAKGVAVEGSFQFACDEQVQLNHIRRRRMLAQG